MSIYTQLMGLLLTLSKSTQQQNQAKKMHIYHFSRDNTEQFYLSNKKCKRNCIEMVMIFFHQFFVKNIIIYILSTMIKLIEEIDFSKQLFQQPQLRAYYEQAAKIIEKEQSDQLHKFKKPAFDEDLQNHLIVTNIPDLKGRQQKFLNFLTQKVLQKKQIGIKDGLLSIEPGFSLNGTEKVYNKTLYLIYKTPGIAKKAHQKLHNLKFDKDHTFACFTVKQFKDIDNVEGQYKAPKIIGKKQKLINNIDEKFRDQFIYTIKQNNQQQLVVKWFDYVEKKTQDVVQGQWSNKLADSANNVVFSPKGTYIAICESEGVRVLGGTNFKEKGFYKHKGASHVCFSPNQTFMITHSIASDKTSSSLIIWAVQSQISLKQLKAQIHQNEQIFQFNSDETLLAIVLNNQLVIYKCDSVETLKKQFKFSEDELVAEGRLIKAPNLQKILWLPDKVTVTCICFELNPAVNAHPSSKIFFYNTKTKQQRKWKAIGQNIKKVQAAISNNADWIAVSFKKIQKKSLSISVIYIVNLLKRDIETEVVEFKENVVSLSWDKQNGRFGVIYELPIPAKNQDVKFGASFYQIQIKDKIQQAVKFAQIPQTLANKIILAQNGTFFAMYNISVFSSGKYKYTLGVISKEAKDTKGKKMAIQIVKKDIEIPYMSFFDMDFSGRFVITGTDKAYQIWTTAGELISRDIFSSEIKNVHFRPRYINKLSNEIEAQIEARQKDIRKKYQEEDQRRINALKGQKEKEREQKKASFKKYLDDKKAWFEQYKKKRDELRGFKEEDPKVKSAIYQHQYLQKNSK